MSLSDELVNKILILFQYRLDRIKRQNLYFMFDGVIMINH